MTATLRLIGLFTSFAIIAPIHADDTTASSIDSALTQKAVIEKRLNSIIIDRLNLAWADPLFFARYITKRSKQLDSEHYGVAVLCRVIGSAPVAPPQGTILHNSAPFHIENAPLRDVLDYYCQFAGVYYHNGGTHYKIEGSSVILIVKTTPDPKAN